MIEWKGERGVRDGSGRQLQAEVFGAKEKNLSFHNIQDRRAASGGGKVRKPLRDLRWFHRFPPCRRVPLCGFRFRFYHQWKLPEEQNLLHSLVRHSLLFLRWCFHSILPFGLEHFHSILLYIIKPCWIKTLEHVHHIALLNVIYLQFHVMLVLTMIGSEI